VELESAQVEDRPMLGPRVADYTGPVAETAIAVAGHTIKLIRPAAPDQLLDDPEVARRNRHDDYMPYWAYLWPAAYLLGDLVAREPWPALNAKQGSGEVLEIGCGLGLPGLVALAQSLCVRFTDYDQTPLDFVERSAALNGFDRTRFSTQRLDWRELPDEQFAVILGADVIYESRLVPLVAGLLVRLLAPDGLALIASPHRVAARAFPDALKAVGLSFRVDSATARSEDGQLIEGVIYRVTR
jgi:predicted nicotinamide N-methyase